MTLNRRFPIGVALALLPFLAAAAPNDDLLKAARSGDSGGVTRALSAGASVGAKDAGGRTALHFAASEGRLEAMRVLIGARAPLDAADAQGATPLEYAALSFQAEAMTLLLDSGASSVSFRAFVASPQGELYPIHEAASQGKVAAIRVFLRYGADPNFPSLVAQGYRPLHFAVFSAGVGTAEARNAALETAKALIGAGARPDAGDAKGKTALAYAIEQGFRPLVDYLVPYSKNPLDALLALRYGDRTAFEALYRQMKAQGQKPEATDDEGYGFLHRAVLLGDPALIRRLVADGANINAKDRSGMTALYRAMEKRDYAVMDALFEAGADPEERYNMGSFRNPLCYAAAQGDLELMRKLMAKGARAYPKGAPDPLIAAIIWQKPEAARLLLDSGAPAGGQRDEGYTPLAAAITWRGSSLQKEVAELLLARGADIDELLGSGDTALDYALRMNSQAGADFLRGKGAHKKDELPKGAAAKQEPAKGENAGKKGAETPQQAAAPAQPQAKEGAGKSGAAPQQPAVVQARDSFFDAVSRGDVVAVSAFLGAGTKLDIVDKEGRTALVLAAQKNNVSLCSLLLARGANPDLVDSQKQSPLHAACAAGAPDAIVALLLGGAAVDLRDNAGRTPLYLAAQNGLLDAIRLLAERGANLNTSDTAGRFAVGMAKLAGRNDAVALLLSLGATDAPAPASPPRKK